MNKDELSWINIVKNYNYDQDSELIFKELQAKFKHQELIYRRKQKINKILED
jgi:hypothetical protein